MCFTNNERLELNQNLAALEDPQAKCLTLAGLYQSYGQLGASVLQELGLNDEAVKAVRLLEADASRLPHMAGVVQAATAKGYIPNPQGKKREEVIAEAKEHPYVKTMYDIYEMMGSGGHSSTLKTAMDKWAVNYINLGHDLNEISQYYEVVNDRQIIGAVPKAENLSLKAMQVFAQTSIMALIPHICEHIAADTREAVDVKQVAQNFKWIFNGQNAFALAYLPAKKLITAKNGGLVLIKTNDIKETFGRAMLNAANGDIFEKTENTRSANE